MNRIVEVNQLKKTYGKKGNLYTALENISFDIEKGEFIGIMGPSGAGKTTLLNIMSTIDTPTSGNVKIAGQNITLMKDSRLSQFRRNELGFIFQEFNLMNSLTVKENILLPLALDKKKVPEIEKRVQKVTQILGIEAIVGKYPTEISVGQRQRVSAARALITEPQLIFADEPTGALDSKSATELLQYLSRINTREETTILMVTHDAFAASYCSRVLFIKDGLLFSEIVRNGTRKDFFKKIIDMQATIGGGVIHDLS